MDSERYRLYLQIFRSLVHYAFTYTKGTSGVVHTSLFDPIPIITPYFNALNSLPKEAREHFSGKPEKLALNSLSSPPEKLALIEKYFGNPTFKYDWTSGKLEAMWSPNFIPTRLQSLYIERDEKCKLFRDSVDPFVDKDLVEKILDWCFLGEKKQGQSLILLDNQYQSPEQYFRDKLHLSGVRYNNFKLLIDAKTDSSSNTNDELLNEITRISILIKEYEFELTCLKHILTSLYHNKPFVESRIATFPVYKIGLLYEYIDKVEHIKKMCNALNLKFINESHWEGDEWDDARFDIYVTLN